MDSQDVITVVNVLADAGVVCWLDGGWGVDALLGRQTRPHEDLDLVLAMSDVPAVIEALREMGFALDADERPCSFTMCTRDRRKVDVHPVAWDHDGGGVQAQPNNSTWTYPARGFTGVGRVAGESVRCLTAEVQILCHDGYELDDGDLQDLEALRTVLADEGPEVRARWRDLVRRGYDTISATYRDDEGRPNSGTEERTEQYGGWMEGLSGVLKPGAKVLDLGCGAGVPAAKLLAAKGFEVVGLDMSAVQIERARRLVPDATFIQADMADWDADPGSLDAVVCLYALIHVPLHDQRELLPRVRRWLRPGGHLLAIVGHRQWSGLENYLGAAMFWDHADAATYLDLLARSGFAVIWNRFVPEGKAGHTLVLARVGLTAFTGSQLPPPTPLQQSGAM